MDEESQSGWQPNLSQNILKDGGSVKKTEEDLNWKSICFESNCEHVELEVPEEHLYGNVEEKLGGNNGDIDLGVIDGSETAKGGISPEGEINLYI